MTANTIRTLAAAGAMPLLSLSAIAQSQVVCTSGNYERTVEVVYETPGQRVPCSVRYAKSGGAAESLWRAKHERGYCERQAVSLVQKLSKAGWSCQAGNSKKQAVAELETARNSQPAADSDATPKAEPEVEAKPEVIEVEAESE